ncbi:hypothetical protein QBC43DRAFT_301524 [Cladorrhinum sp. PSN259]|nr:hypothetical protein QBC43DRAFT_301524 [Cladorrhinum sp. PSN259]
MSPPTAPSSILLLGKGELGTAILSYLTSHSTYSPTSTKITILCRTPPTPSSLPDGVSYTLSDITSTPLDELITIFNDHTTIIQASGFGFPPGTHLKIAEAALAAPNVSHFIPWQFGVDYDVIGKGGAHGELFGEFLEVRALLRDGPKLNRTSKLRWNVISSGLFMSFLFGVKEFGAVEFGEEVTTVRGLGGWGNKVTLTDVDGIGRMVTEVVFSNESTTIKGGEEGDGVVYIGGETVTYEEVADVLEGVLREKNTGIKLKREELGLDEIRDRLAKEPDDRMFKYQGVFGEGVGVWWEKERMLNYRLGIPLKGVREWLVENIDGLLKH